MWLSKLQMRLLMIKFCPKCEDYHSTKRVDRQETYAIHDQKIAVAVKVAICAECGESLGSDKDDQAILDAVHAEYRKGNEK